MKTRCFKYSKAAAKIEWLLRGNNKAYLDFLQSQCCDFHLERLYQCPSEVATHKIVELVSLQATLLENLWLLAPVLQFAFLSQALAWHMTSICTVT